MSSRSVNRSRSANNVSTAGVISVSAASNVGVPSASRADTAPTESISSRIRPLWSSSVVSTESSSDSSSRTVPPRPDSAASASVTSVRIWAMPEPFSRVPTAASVSSTVGPGEVRSAGIRCPSADGDLSRPGSSAT